jgi:hypothetical protein
MAEQPTQATPPQIADAPETAALLLATFADLYRQEVGAEEDVHRALPFFGTALGIVVGALAYAAGRLPKWPDVTTREGLAAFGLASALLAAAVVEAACVLVFLSRAIARRNYQRIGPETALRARVAELQAFYDEQPTAGPQQDRRLVNDLREILLDSYAEITPLNRRLNQRRYRFRALAASHLVRSLIWALGATTVIFMADKLAYFPKVAS